MENVIDNDSYRACRRASRPTPGGQPRLPRVETALGGADRPVAGRYLLVDRIGSGGMGTVWRAFDLRTQSWLAVKLLTQRSSSLLLRFVREQGLRIPHPHVVAPTGWAAEDDLVVLTMDLVRGGSVEKLLAEQGTLPTPYVALLLDQLLQALAAVHAAGVVHRDVKPANLLLEATSRGRPHLRLADFGVAATRDQPRLTRHPGAVGTEGYSAPEQEAGDPPDPRADLYAAGRVAVQLLTGSPGSAVPDDALAPLLTRLLQHDPDDRPDSAAAALVELRSAAVGEWAGGVVVPDRLPPVTLPLAAAPAAVPVSPVPVVERPRTRVLAAAGCFAGAIALCLAALARVLGQ
jgi:eukaryotic-like serine/threonine-protein kinase